MRLQAVQVDAFAALSHDRSPLHVDAAYARRTPFGRPVVHGVAGILIALGAWAEGRRFALDRIVARFHRPLFTGEDYDVVVDGERLELVRHGETHLALEFAWRPRGDEPDATFAGFAPAESARTGELPRALTVPSIPYAPGATALAALAALGLTAEQVPAHQIALLCWASYAVGMELVGRDALFTSMEVSFAALSATERFSLRDVEVRFDERFGRATITGAGTGVAAFALTAFRRPAPVEGDLASVANAVGAGRAFADQKVLVTGSSRGFGAALARAFAVAGARVTLSARSHSPELARVAEDVATCAGQAGGLPPELLIGDVTDPAVAGRAGALDILVNSAIPPIPLVPFAAESLADFLDFITRAVAMTAAPCHALLARVGCIVNISSVYASHPEPRLAHYVAAKLAVEGLTRTLALEHPDRLFVIARPPRMLTDQTNGLVKSGSLASSSVIAAALLARLRDLPSGRNLHEVDL